MQYDPAAPPTNPNLYALPKHFSQTQGQENWRYYSVPTGEAGYVELGWGNAPLGAPGGMTACWREVAGGAPAIGRDALRPVAGRDAAVAWRRGAGSGQVDITATLRCLEPRAGGDGVDVSIWRGETRLLGPMHLLGNSGQEMTFSTTGTLATGDSVYLRVSSGANDTGDWCAYSMQVTLE